MAAETKTLEQAYDGMLSRDWPKLLDAIERGETRVTTYRVYDQTYAGVMNCEFSHGKTWYYGLVSAKHTPQTREDMIEWLEENGVGFFPTKGDLE